MAEQDYRALNRLVKNANVFLATHWGRTPVRIVGAAEDEFNSILRLADIEQLLATVPIPADLVRLYRNGRAEQRELYADIVHVASHVEYSYVVPDKLFNLHSTGGTVVVSAIHVLWPPVRELCGALADELSHPVDAYVFLTPAGSNGLSTHVDHEATFLLQLSGTKRWTLFPQTVPHPQLTRPVDPDPGATTETFELRAGDVLYIPPGTPHSGAAGNEAASAHLNLSVTLTSWRKALMDLVAALTEDESYLAPLPPRGSMDTVRLDAVVRDQIARLTAALSEVSAEALFEARGRA